MKIRKHRVVANKLPYTQGKRPAVDCILCAVVRDDPAAANLTVFQHRGHLVSLNLFPYNIGHVLIFPAAHVQDIRELSEQDVLVSHRLQALSLRVLEKVYRAVGFNVGYNIGEGSGGSIPHLHQHVVPRFRNELGFFDILTDSRTMPEDPQVTREQLTQAHAEEATAILGAE